MIEHKEICLKINGKQTVTSKSGFIEFKNCPRQIPAPFEIYTDFECILKSVKSNKKQVVLILKNIKITFLAFFAYKLVCVDNKFSKPVVLYRGENAAYSFIKTMLEEFGYCKKAIKKHFNKNAIMTEKEEEHFQSSNTYWIC